MNQKSIITALAGLVTLAGFIFAGVKACRKLHRPRVLTRQESLDLKKGSFIFDREKYLAFMKQARTRSPVNYSFHTITHGENYWTIRKKYGIKSVFTIFGCNPFIPDVHARLSWQIVIPKKDGILHIAGKGETVESIADLYNLEKKESIERLANINKNFYGRFQEKQIVFVPWAKLPTEWMAEKLRQSYMRHAMFASPLGPRRVSSKFGMRKHPIFKVNRMHKGIDIPAKPGTSVHAAAGGVVAFKGWMTGYGRTVQLVHKNGFTTTYGHLRSYPKWLKPGIRVQKHQIIGWVGSTGWSTGPHLDFSIRKNGKPVNPLKYLGW